MPRRRVAPRAFAARSTSHRVAGLLSSPLGARTTHTEPSCAKAMALPSGDQEKQDCTPGGAILPRHRHERRRLAVVAQAHQVQLRDAVRPARSSDTDGVGGSGPQLARARARADAPASPGPAARAILPALLPLVATPGSGTEAAAAAAEDSAEGAPAVRPGYARASVRVHATSARRRRGRGRVVGGTRERAPATGSHAQRRGVHWQIEHEKLEVFPPGGRLFSRRSWSHPSRSRPVPDSDEASARPSSSPPSGSVSTLPRKASARALPGPPPPRRRSAERPPPDPAHVPARATRSARPRPRRRRVGRAAPASRRRVRVATTAKPDAGVVRGHPLRVHRGEAFAVHRDDRDRPEGALDGRTRVGVLGKVRVPQPSTASSYAALTSITVGMINACAAVPPRLGPA